MAYKRIWRLTSDRLYLYANGAERIALAPFYGNTGQTLRVRGRSIYSPAPGLPEPGTYRPDATTTGTLPGVPLSPYYGNRIITTAGTVIQNQDVYGDIIVRAPNVTIRNCKVRGAETRSLSGNTSLIDCDHANAVGTLVEDCELRADFPNVWTTGMKGHDYIARRLKVSRCVDGFGAFNANSGRTQFTNVLIEACYISDLSYFNDDPNHTPPETHNDAVQIQGGENTRVVGCHFRLYASPGVGAYSALPARGFPRYEWGQGITVSPNVSKVEKNYIAKNWIYGGQAGMAIAHNNKLPMAFGYVGENRFGRDQHFYSADSQYQIRYTSGITFDNPLSLNVFDDNSQPFAVGKTLGIRIDG